MRGENNTTRSNARLLAALAMLTVAFFLSCCLPSHRQALTEPWRLETVVIHSEEAERGVSTYWVGVSDQTVVIALETCVIALDLKTLQEKWRRPAKLYLHSPSSAGGGVSLPAIAGGAVVVPRGLPDPDGLLWFSLEDGHVIQSKDGLFWGGVSSYRNGLIEGSTIIYDALGNALAGFSGEGLAFADSGTHVYTLTREPVPGSTDGYDLFICKYNPTLPKPRLLWRTGDILCREKYSIATLTSPAGVELFDSKVFAWRGNAWAVVSTDSGTIHSKGEFGSGAECVQSGRKIVLFEGNGEESVSVYDTVSGTMKSSHLPVGPLSIVPYSEGFVVFHEEGASFLDASGETLTPGRVIAPQNWRGAYRAHAVSLGNSAIVVWATRGEGVLLLGKLTGDPRK